MTQLAEKHVTTQHTAPSPRATPLAARSKIGVYGHRPRSDMLRVMLADMGFDSENIETLSLDHRGPCLIDAEILTADEKSALMAVEPLGRFRDPIFLLDNSGYIWPENLETLNTLARVAAIPKILDEYQEQTWAQLETNLRIQSRRIMKLAAAPRNLTDRFRVMILIQTTSDIPGEIKTTLQQSFLNVEFAFSESEALHKAENIYNAGETIDAILDLVPEKTDTLPKIPRLSVKHLHNSVTLHGVLMKNKKTHPLQPTDIDFTENELSATYTQAFPKTFWKAHAKSQIQTYGRLNMHVSIFSVPLELTEEGRLTAHVRAFDSVGRISKTRMGVVFVGKSFPEGEAFLSEIGFANAVERISLSSEGIDRL